MRGQVVVGVDEAGEQRCARATSIDLRVGGPGERRGAGPRPMMRSPSMTTAASGTGAAPVPSISVAPVRTRIIGLTLVELTRLIPRWNSR